MTKLQKILLCSRAMNSILTSIISFSLIFFFMIYQTRGSQFSMDEQLNLEKVLRKYALNTIVTQDGDMYDCVDVYKQPSLDHPLLQNHTVQLKPSFALDEFNNGSYHGNVYPRLGLENGGCAEGSVPIRRIQKEDITRIQSHLVKFPTSINPNSLDKPGWHFAQAKTIKLGVRFTGARGMFNVYNPSVAKEQHSDSIVFVSRGMLSEYNAIHAGWSAFPAIYGDGQTRLHTQWTADNYKTKGCIDIRCKGFVQVNKALPLGYRLNPVSTYGGSQYLVPVTIVQDQFSGNWWLIVSFNVMVGYWPKELFTGLSGYADEVGWGGRVFSTTHYTPPMGSGHRAGEGFKKSCFVEQMQYTQSGHSSFQDLSNNQLIAYKDSPDCYDLNLYMDLQKRRNMYFGGPGGYCGWPV